MSRFKELLHDKKLMSGIYAVTLVTALLVLALVVKGPEESGKLVSDRSGNIIGINRRSMDRNERYDLSLVIEDGQKTMTRDVTLTLQAGSDGRNGMNINRQDSREAEIDAAVDNMISGIEYSRKKKIRLPSALPDGTVIRWTGTERSAGPVMLIIPLMYVSLVILMTAGAFRKDRADAEKRKSIMRGLPRFCNQLYLMMNAGLILSDAMDNISDGYRISESSSLFERDLAELQEATDGHRISTAQVLNEYAVKNDVKEMIRIAAILAENEKRGSDVVESL
ncbi:MAG: hypothetical protein IKF42_13270, partial [Mogibacterium sp.]|nr:hypothetical protein [Mogibacterium sp.]